MNDLAISYHKLGRHAEALKQFEETLALRKAKLGPNDYDTLTSMNDLANSYRAQGRHAEGLKLHEETLAVWKAKLGPDDPSTLNIMNHLAAAYAALGRYAEALKLFEETLALRKVKLGPDHPDTLGSMQGVAGSLARLDRGAEAVPVIDECLAHAVGKPVSLRVVLGVANQRLRHFQKAGDPAGCRATAEMWDKLGRKDAESLYSAARFRAAAAAVQKKTPGADAGRLATKDADRAMAWLTETVAAGFQDRSRMEKDRDLDALRGREDFRKLLASLPKANASAPPAKK